jgi:D-alanyl-D-alanine carboxypeptidase
MRRLAARRAGGLSDRGPSPRRPSVAMLAAGLVAVLLLVVATVVWWPRDRAAAPASSVSPSRASRPLTDPAALQKQLDRVLEAGAPGVVGLVRAGERTWQGASGLGDLRANRPARASDRFRIGSVTKSFVATLVLQLVGEGRLRLDDSLEPVATRPGPRGRAGHRPAAAQPHQRALRLQRRPVRATPSLPAPGAGRHRHRPQAAVRSRDGVLLQQPNYILAGLLVERVTGRRLADQLEQRILEPLGLDDTELPTTQRAVAGPHVRGYAPPDEDWQVTDGPARLVDVTEMDTSWAWAAGAMVSTTADLARFYQALLGGQLHTPELLKQMRTTVDASRLGHGTRCGLGLEVLRLGCGVELWGHGGSLEGYQTTAFSTPDAHRQLVMAINLQPEPEPWAAAAAVENILRREVSC